MDGIDDPHRTKKFVVNMEYVMSKLILISSQAMAKELHPVGETSNIQEVTSDTRQGNTELLCAQQQRDWT
jgi:hypothetical protein